MDGARALILGGWVACAPAPPEPVEAPAPSAPPGARLDTHREMVEDAKAPRHPADGGGTVRWLEPPPPLRVGDRAALSLVIEVGPEGIAEGGAIHFLPEPFWGWSPPQATDPLAPGHTSARASASEVHLRPESYGGQLVWHVEGAPLAPRDTVTVIYGDGPARARVDRFADDLAALWVGVDGDGDGVRALLPHPLRLRVEAGEARGLWVTATSVARVGAPIDVTVAALDAVGNLAADWAEPVALTWPTGWTGPAQVSLSDGTARLTATAAAEGLGTVLASSGPLVGQSNPSLVRDAAAPILWADLQIHTGRSDGTGSVAAAYRYARDVAGLDVAAVTDHDHWGLAFLDDHPALWEEAIREAQAATTDRFVAFPAYEWTSWIWGHRHVLYVGEPGPLLSSIRPPTDTPAGLHKALRAHDAIVIPHHPAGGPVPVAPEAPLDAALEPVVEVVSVHGQSDDPRLPGVIRDARPEAFLQRRLAKGERFGLIGSTDGHDGHPGLAKLAGGQGGLAALIDAPRTRAGVAEALRSRRVYATNGPRIILRFEVDGHPMGSERPAGPVAAEVRVIGTAPIAWVELVRGEIVERTAGQGAVLRHAWAFDAAPGEAAYVRLLQEDGGMAWSSPVFFTR